MRLALQQAREAAEAGEVPVGAVLVSSSGDVMAAARNRCEVDLDPTAHAEMLVIRQAAAQRSAWRLLDATLYVTLEPCPMCAGALLQARVQSVVYGARNSLLGADGSWIAMLGAGQDATEAAEAALHARREGGEEAPYASAIAAQQQQVRPQRPHPFHPTMQVRRGVLEEECAGAMKDFFKRRRQEGAGRKVEVGL